MVDHQAVIRKILLTTYSDRDPGVELGPLLPQNAQNFFAVWKCFGIQFDNLESEEGWRKSEENGRNPYLISVPQRDFDCGHCGRCVENGFSWI
jgi:hypothetical protein